MDDRVRAFVERLLDDWEQDEHQLAGEFCVGDAENQAVRDGIAARRAEWAELAGG